MTPRFMRPLVIALAIAAPVGLAVAQKRKADGKYSRPNLAAADRLVQQAYGKFEAAQKANEYDLGGHAAKAKTLLKQAQDEIKLANKAAED